MARGASSPPADLGTLGTTSVGYGVNDNGTVVGGSVVSSGVHDAFVWTSGTGMVDLNAAGVVANLAGSGFPSSTTARPSTTQGRSPGSETAAGGATDAFLLTPYLSGDANLDGKVDINDLTIVLANFGQTAGMNWGTGDFIGDGKVDINDLTIVLGKLRQKPGLRLVRRRPGRGARAGRPRPVVGRHRCAASCWPAAATGIERSGDQVGQEWYCRCPRAFLPRVARLWRLG